MSRSLSAACLSLVFGVFGIVGVAPPLRAQPPVETPGQQALLAGEDPAAGTSVPELGEASSPDLMGKPIRRIDVVTLGGRWASPIVTSVRPGDPATPEAARRLMRDVLAQGRFARANVEALAAAEGGVVLRLNVLPRRILASITLIGGVLEESETLEAAGVTAGAEITAPMLDAIAGRVQRFYQQHGYPFVEVRVAATDTDNDDQVVLAISVVPGTPRTVKQRIFVMDPAAEREVGALRSAYRIHAGSRVDTSALGDADRELTETLRQHGFFRAEVHHALRHQETRSYLYVSITPGPRLVPSFDGHRAFDTSELEAALNLQKAPDDRAPELTDRLRAFYVARGFPDAEVHMVEQGKPDDPVHYLAFTIREHRQVRVTKMEFPCFTPDGDLTPKALEREIGSFLEEDLPGAETFSPPDPRLVERSFGPSVGAGGRGVPPDLRPLLTYAPDTYDRALKHLKDLFRSKGYLNAVVGPMAVLRATCDRRSKAGQCIPVLPRASLLPRCLHDSLGLPVPEPRLPDTFTCRPDPAHDVECSPDITVRIPIALGPKTTLYDLAFEGNKAISSADLAKLAALPLGTPLSSVDVEAARVRLLDDYRRRGYAYADITTGAEASPDRTRARIRFFVTEREQVMVKGFVVKGASRTDERLILGRVALRYGAPFQQDLARRTEERIATLGAFSSVTVSLEDGEVPERQKRVVITVVESASQYLESRPGFSTGEGMRLVFEWGHRNLGGLAISTALRAQFGYLFDFLIVDPTVKSDYARLNPDQRLEQHHTLSFNFPELGLGPLVSLSLDTMVMRHNARDYGNWKAGVMPTLTYRPLRQVTMQLGPSGEYNNVALFNVEAKDATLALLRAPVGETMALAERFSATVNTVDKPLDPRRGVLATAAIEHVNTIPLGYVLVPVVGRHPMHAPDTPSHFISFTGRFAGHIPFSTSGVRLALSLSAGYNMQLTEVSKTYPDRLFFLGGVDSIRSFLADSLMPQDLWELIRDKKTNPATGKPWVLEDVALRGGDLFINPRLELRVPITGIFEAALFLDAGNVWRNPSKIDAVLRYGAGPALLVATPIGPLSFSYGINLNRRMLDPATQRMEDFGAFHFKIGAF